MILVSACLVGENCRYDGGNCANDKVRSFLAGQDYLPLCPEVLGGLPTPRQPAEIRGNQVVDADGLDRSAAFRTGAEAVLALCQQHQIKLALLKEGSPSCGGSRVYDGSFSGRRIAGQGVTAALLRAHGIQVIGENDLPE